MSPALRSVSRDLETDGGRPRAEGAAERRQANPRAVWTAAEENGYASGTRGTYRQTAPLIRNKPSPRQLSTSIAVFESRLGRCEDCRRGLDDLDANRIGKERRENLKQRGSKGFSFRSQNRWRGRRSRQCPFNQRRRRDVVAAADLNPADLREPAAVEPMLIDLAMTDDPGFANGTEQGVISRAPRIDLGPSGP